MAIALGQNAGLARKKGATWGTQPSDPTTNALFPFVTLDMQKTVESLPNEAKNDTAMRQASDEGVSRVEGSFSRYAHYQGSELPLALTLGTAGVPAQIGSTDYYVHRFTVNKSLQGVFGAAFVDLETNIEEFDSLKFNSVTIAGDRGSGRVTTSYEVMGRDVNTGGDITWGNLTENADAVNNHVLWNHLLFYENDQSAGAVTGGTAINLQSFSITFANNCAEHFTNAGKRLEPVRSNYLDVTGSFTLDTYEDTTLVADITARTLKKLGFVFTSGSYAFKIFVPACRFSGSLPGVSDAGRISQTIAFTAEKCSSNPTDMLSTMPYIDIFSQDTGNPLA